MEHSNIDNNAMHRILDDDILKPGMSVFVEKSLQSRQKVFSYLDIAQVIDSFIKHSPVAIMLCLLRNLSANSVWLRVSLLTRHTSHTSYHPSGSGHQLFVALCSPRIYRLSLSHRDLLTVMSVLGFHILYSADIKTVSKYN